jgi:glucosamine-phosphate N-acetyltransferase
VGRILFLRTNQEKDFLLTLSNLGDCKLTHKEFAEIRRRRKCKRVNTLAYLEEGRVVSTLSFFIEDKFIHNGSKVCHVEDVATRQGHEGKGYASQLLEYVKNYARNQGCYKVVLYCSPELVQFYEKNGFHKGATLMRFDL